MSYYDKHIAWTGAGCFAAFLLALVAASFGSVAADRACQILASISLMLSCSCMRALFKKNKERGIMVRSKSQQGMSLIELMVAMFILLVGLLGCAALIPLSIGVDSLNKQRSDSTVIAKMMVEKISSAYKAGDLTFTPPPYCGNAPFSAADNPSPYIGSCNGYTVNWTIVPSNPSSRTKLVTVTVVLNTSIKSPMLVAPPVTIQSLIGGQ